MKNIKLIAISALIVGFVSFYATQPDANQTIVAQNTQDVQEVVTMQKMQLFIYDGCPFCDKVITFLKNNNLLDKVELVDAGLPENKELLQKVSNKTQAPYLFDKDASVSMPESNDIIEYFTKKYDIQKAEPVAQVKPLAVTQLPTTELSVTPSQVTQLQVASLSNIEDTQKVHDVATFLPNVIQLSKPVVILVSTTWCPPCKAFKPIFLEVAQEMAQDCEFICVDGDANQEILVQLEISSFPTLIYYKDGKRVYLKDDRTKHGFIDLVKQFIKK